MLLDNCRVLDVERGTTTGPHAVEIRDGLIRAVTSAGGLEPRSGQERLNLQGRVVMPGLWDVHCHPGMHAQAMHRPDEPREVRLANVEESLRGALRSGVTGVRITGEAFYTDLELRGRADLPRIVASGPAIKAPRGHGWRRDWPYDSTLRDPFGSTEVADLRELVAAVDARAHAGCDWVKLFVTGGIAGDEETPDDLQFDAELLDAACERAHGHGLRVAAHLGNPRATGLALDAGVDSVEHGYALDAATVERMAEAGTFYVPTLGVTHAIDRMREMGWPEVMIDRARRVQPVHRRSFEFALAAGVKIASGSDMRPLAVASTLEVLLLARAGLSTAGALRAATLDAARLCGLGSEVGSVAPGRAADLLIVDDDPTERLEVIKAPHLVLREGVVVGGHGFNPPWAACRD